MLIFFFFSRCLVGDFVTEGEGNGKRTSKARAAELMLEKFRELPPLASCQTPPKKKTSKETVAANVELPKAVMSTIKILAVNK